MLRQYQIIVSGKSVNLITREGTSWFYQWWYRTWGPGFSTTIWGLLEDNVLWMPHEEAKTLKDLGLTVNVVMFPGHGPNGFIHQINVAEEAGIVKVYGPDITVDDVLVTDKKSGKEWMMHERWRAMN